MSLFTGICENVLKQSWPTARGFVLNNYILEASLLRPSRSYSNIRTIVCWRSLSTTRSCDR